MSPRPAARALARAAAVSAALAAGPAADAGPAPLLRGAPLAVSGIELTAVAREGGLALEGRRGGTLLFTSRPVALLSVEAGRLEGPEGPELLLALERHPSPLDGEEGPRPYVYEVTPRGLVARWRGSGLAWPLVDARLLPGGRLLCALHRGDSFLVPAVGADERRAAVYRWNGFGFSAAGEPADEAACRALWGLPP